MQSLNK